MQFPLIGAFALLSLCPTGSAAAQSCSGMSLGNNASLNGFVPFPSANLWNTRISSAPVDPNSDAITSSAGFAGLHLHPDFGAGSDYGIPYVVVDSSVTPLVPINVIDYADESDVVVAPIPPLLPSRVFQPAARAGQILSPLHPTEVFARQMAEKKNRPQVFRDI